MGLAGLEEMMKNYFYRKQARMDHRLMAGVTTL